MEEVSRKDNVSIRRMPVEMSSYHAVLEPVGEHDTPPALLLAMHGYGQASKNFVRTFAPLTEHNVLVVAPQGVHQFYWTNYRPAFCWMTSFQREQTIEDNLGYMAQLYDSLLKEHCFDPDRVYLLGFSQGVAMAFRFASSGHIAPRGLIACGGDLPPEIAERLDTIAPYPALIMHGRDDEMVPMSKSEACVEALQQHNFPVEAHYFEGGHDIPEEQVSAIHAWMNAL